MPKHRRGSSSPSSPQSRRAKAPASASRRCSASSGCPFPRASGHPVLEASRGHEALRLCERYGGPLDLVVTDVVMPGMSGRELAERLGPLLPETRVLYMSGHTDSETVRLKAAASKI